jgi:hypothetical protein
VKRPRRRTKFSGAQRSVQKGRRHGVVRPTQQARRASEAVRGPRGGRPGESKSELEQDVKEVRKGAEDGGEALRKAIEKNKGKISAWWIEVQRSWNQHLREIRKHIGRAARRARMEADELAEANS